VAPCNEAKLNCSSAADINDPAGSKWSTVIDTNRNAASIGRVGNAHPTAKGKRAMSRCQFGALVSFTTRGGTAFELARIIRGTAATDSTGGGGVWNGAFRNACIVRHRDEGVGDVVICSCRGAEACQWQASRANCQNQAASPPCMVWRRMSTANHERRFRIGALAKSNRRRGSSSSKSRWAAKRGEIAAKRWSVSEKPSHDIAEQGTIRLREVRGHPC
jgi:hypothetical protein